MKWEPGLGGLLGTAQTGDEWDDDGKTFLLEKVVRRGAGVTITFVPVDAEEDRAAPRTEAETPTPITEEDLDGTYEGPRGATEIGQIVHREIDEAWPQPGKNVVPR